jgi:hypothetical protein
VFRVAGALDLDALSAAWQATVDQHAILRSEFAATSQAGSTGRFAPR